MKKWFYPCRNKNPLVNQFQHSRIVNVEYGGDAVRKRGKNYIQNRTNQYDHHGDALAQTANPVIVPFSLQHSGKGGVVVNNPRQRNGNNGIQLGKQGHCHHTVQTECLIHEMIAEYSRNQVTRLHTPGRQAFFHGVLYNLLCFLNLA